MNRRKLTLLWRRLDRFEFGKDVVLIPKLLGRELDCNVDIVCGFDADMEAEVRAHETASLKFINRPLSTKPRQRIPVNLRYLKEHARDIDILMCFHFRPETIINVLAYKRFNPRGKVYIKLDTISGREFDLSRFGFIQRWLRKIIYRKVIRITDVISVETTSAKDNILATAKDFDYLAPKLALVPNPFDEDEFRKQGLKVKTFNEKENIIITVGRLGTHQKNTELLLDAVGSIDLKGWKCCLIGPGTPEIKEMARKTPGVEMIGVINDKEKLWGWYNKAKVFVLTSRFESYGLVLSEAARFADYIISTDVGAAKDIMKDHRGMIIADGDVKGLTNALSRIIEGEEDISRITPYINENTVFTVSRLLCQQRH